MQVQPSPAAKRDNKSLLAPIVLAVSACLHLAFLGYAALQPAPVQPADHTARVQVMQYQHDQASESWTVMGRRWAKVSRDKLAAR